MTVAARALRPRTTLVGVAALAALTTTGALAHHGWSWAEADQIELNGEIREIYVGPPHPVLRVAAADGDWSVELGNPNQTRRSGFTEESAAVGDSITALGNRSEDPSEKRMKAVRVTVRERTYDIYPDRIRSN